MTKNTNDTDDEIIKRAIAAFMREPGADQPSEGMCEVRGDHVVLRNLRGDLATYRVTKAGRLSRVD
ncbi:MAG: hypothetical protein JNK64_20870 [Myxococcales bacterium]|nr:hypothetical protein [Myxococcales bacterium]